MSNLSSDSPLFQRPESQDAGKGGSEAGRAALSPVVSGLRDGADLTALVRALLDALAALATAQRADSPSRPLADAVHPLDVQDTTRGRDSASRRRTGAGGVKPAYLLTLDEVYAELGGIARSTFYDWRAKGKAPRCIKLPNGDLRVRRSEFDRWLKEREDAA